MPTTLTLEGVRNMVWTERPCQVFFSQGHPCLMWCLRSIFQDSWPSIEWITHLASVCTCILLLIIPKLISRGYIKSSSWIYGRQAFFSLNPKKLKESFFQSVICSLRRDPTGRVIDMSGYQYLGAYLKLSSQGKRLCDPLFNFPHSTLWTITPQRYRGVVWNVKGMLKNLKICPNWF